MATIPKLRTPFRVTITGSGVKAQVVEQDSIQDVTQCVYAILATPPGSRLDYPEMGVEDPTFSELDLEDVRAMVETYEPRAEVLTDSALDDAIQRVSVQVAVR